MIIRKSDGGYNYSTTDLATVRYRVDKVNCDRAIYVVGSDQALHFRMVFAVAREAGWLPAGDDFEHAQIGMVQGKDGHRLRTRAGDKVKLSDLLTEGVERARAILDEVERDDEGLDLDAIAEDVGIGAIKYADLSTARDSAYIFDWDRMISFKGNTGPYLQYATTRIRSIFRRAGIDEADAARPDRGHRAGRAGARPQAARVRRGRHPGRGDRGAAPAVRATSSRSPACSPRSTSSARCSRPTTRRRGSPGSPCARRRSAC